MARVLHISCQTLMFLMGEMSQMREMILQNCMALDLLTAAQGSACALTCKILHLYPCPLDIDKGSFAGPKQDPLTHWWESLESTAVLW